MVLMCLNEQLTHGYFLKVERYIDLLTLHYYYFLLFWCSVQNIYLLLISIFQSYYIDQQTNKHESLKHTPNAMSVLSQIEET